MSFLDEGKSSFDFPMPDGEFLPNPDDLEVGDKVTVNAPCKNWRLLDLRGKGGIGKNADWTVINLRAMGLDDDYQHTGEVAYWLSPASVDNTKHPNRRVASMLANFMVSLGLAEQADFEEEGMTGEGILKLLVRAAEAKTPHATFTGKLSWSVRKYKGKDGNEYTSEDTGIAYLDNVELEEVPF